jgi:hypothetical protein
VKERTLQSDVLINRREGVDDALDCLNYLKSLHCLRNGIESPQH